MKAMPEDVTRSPLYEPFTRMTVDAGVKANYQAQGQAALREMGVGHIPVVNVEISNNTRRGSRAAV